MKDSYTKCFFPSKHYRDVVSWLSTNVQQEHHRVPYHGSTTAQFVEYRSQDETSWIVRIQGSPAKAVAKFIDPKIATMFVLRWS